ncbi:MAG: hypothetical protein ABI361_06585 [Nitrososphaera sp.]
MIIDGADGRDEFEIQDPAGVVIPNISPSLKITDESAAAKVLQRLVHLSKYSNILALDNFNTASPLARRISVEIYSLQKGFETGDKPMLTGLKAAADGTYTITSGLPLVFRIRNDSDSTLNVTALDLAPDWEISQIYPTAADFFSIDAGKFEDVFLTPSLPNGYKLGTDVLKVFGTLGASSFRPLLLPPLDQMPVTRRGDVTRGIPGELDKFLSAMTDETSVTRALTPNVNASYEWTTTAVQVQIRASNLVCHIALT